MSKKRKLTAKQEALKKALDKLTQEQKMILAVRFAPLIAIRLFKRQQ